MRASPRSATCSFDRPLPEEGASVAWWLRLNWVRTLHRIGRSCVHGMGWPRDSSAILLALAIIPVGDMLVILAVRGTTKSAFGMHGVTAMLMVFQSS
jgi:hypothetical protein